MAEWLINKPTGEPQTSIMFAHGAGAPMDTDFMSFFAQRLSEFGHEVIRFEFPYMAARRLTGNKRPPDKATVLLHCWREQIELARSDLPPGRRLIIGGKSMGGRMASMLADECAADGLVCLGYPFHPSGKPEQLRVEHLRALKSPTLIVQGERDPLGSRQEVQQYTLAPAIKLHWLPDGDHDLKPRIKSGFSQQQHLQHAAEAIHQFANQLAVDSSIDQR